MQLTQVNPSYLGLIKYHILLSKERIKHTQLHLTQGSTVPEIEKRTRITVNSPM